jgi:hypothetical protein
MYRDKDKEILGALFSIEGLRALDLALTWCWYNDRLVVLFLDLRKGVLSDVEGL